MVKREETGKEGSEDLYIIRDLQQVKALSDPIKLKILEAICLEPKTTKQVAEVLEEKQPTKLYHHVEALERVGLIKLVKTKANRGTVERYYQSVANRFQVDKSLFDISQNEEVEGEERIDPLESIFNGALKTTMEEIKE